VVGPASLVAIPTSLFLAVYLGCLVSAGRVLGGAARRAAAPAAVAVVIMLAYCGWAIAAPVLVALAVTGAGFWSLPEQPRCVTVEGDSASNREEG
jgi:amino acid efflux transporter